LPFHIRIGNEDLQIGVLNGSEKENNLAGGLKAYLGDRKPPMKVYKKE